MEILICHFQYDWLWPVSITGKMKGWPVNFPISPDIVRWPAIISSPEVYERVGKSVISFCKNDLKGLRKDFMAVKKSRKHSGFVIYSHLKDSKFKTVQRNAKF